MTALIIHNVLVWSAQAAVLIAVGAVAARLMRKGEPRMRLLHWQLLLAACLLLPLLEPWQKLKEDAGSVTFSPGSAVAVSAPAARATIPWDPLLAAVLLGGSSLLMARLALGTIRLHLYRRRSTPLEKSGTEVEFRVSNEVSGPITFGWRRPVALLPAGFLDLPPESQAAIQAHEAAHVRRADWLFAVGEELIRCALWFHPGIWYLIARIHLAREQVVDREVVETTGNREAYLDALLAIAGLKTKLDFVPAPLFIRQRHFAERVAILLKEVSPMNRKRMLLSLTASVAAIIISATVSSMLLPLRAAQSNGSQGADIRAEAKGGPQVLYRHQTQYPPEAKLKRIEGTVQVDVTIDGRGLVTDARVLSGPEELRRAALQSVLQWQFTATGAPAHTEVEINFSLQDKGQGGYLGQLKRIEMTGLSPDLQTRLAPRIPVKVGDTLSQDAPAEIQKAVAEVDPRIRANVSADGVLHVSMAPMALRIGGNVQSAKLVKKVPPHYPPEAKQSRLQGTVRLMVRIAKDGKVENVELIEGHPMLAEAAIEAVKQWEYKTTLLNGNPVAVLTQVDVNFTLQDQPPPPAAANQ
ncbi:MAG: M56 family metallopeptidase [Bryobacterales bacterium]|nr:M56 family metallopeptidase [Bryobacterales bacterium]